MSRRDSEYVGRMMQRLESSRQVTQRKSGREIYECSVGLIQVIGCGHT